MPRNEDILDQTLPSNDDAEQIILGSVLLYNELFTDIRNVLVPSDFYSPFNRMVYGAMIELFDNSEVIDPIKIGEVLKKKGTQPENYGGLTRITNLTFGLPHFSAAAVAEHVELVKRHSIARSLIRVCSTVTSDLLYGQEDLSDVLERAEQSLLQSSSRLHSDSITEGQGFYSLAEIVPDLHEHLEAYHRGERTGVPTGMVELDDMLAGGGLQNGGMYVLAAGEKTGKTSLALDWSYHIAAKENRSVAFVTLEMSKMSLIKRIHSAHTGVPHHVFRPGIGSTFFNRAIEGLPSLSEVPIYIADQLFTLDQIKRHLHRIAEQSLKTSQPLGLIVLDYLQLLGLKDIAGSRTEEVSKVSRYVRQLSSEMNLPIIIMSSLNRMGLSEGQEPSTMNLRDSGSIAFDAESVMFLHNPAFIPGKPYVPQEITPINLIVAAQRNGPTGRIKLMFVGPYMQFLTENDYVKLTANANDSVPTQTKAQHYQQTKEQLDMWDTSDDDEWK